jgi:uncharacterized SAM-binding protein YcdF (DUF218 family)
MIARSARADRRRWLPPLLILVLLILLWSSGFAWFVRHVGRPIPPAPPTRGIVALTGGAGRVDAALRLLMAHPDSILLISGIGGGTDLDTLTTRAGIDLASVADRVTLGRTATSTRGNAAEARAWAAEHRIEAITIVTASFHMPRALVEFGRALPHVTLAAHASDTGRQRVSLRVLIGEYNKLLAAAVGLSGLLAEREQPRLGPAPG